VVIRESRDGVRANPKGVRLEPGERVGDVLPLLVRRGPSIFGIHHIGDRLTYPLMQDGRLTARQLITCAAEFDAMSGDERFSATAFVRHLLPSIRGTDEHRHFTAIYKQLVKETPDTEEEIA
jgi:hypothetical protein